MLLLLDTHILLWAAYRPERLTPAAREVLLDPANSLMFSAVSIWEVAIKSALGRRDFVADPRVLRRGLFENGYAELPMMGAHAAAVADLPAIHQDPFDRALVAQARIEGAVLGTVDAKVIAYGSPVLDLS
ncbi:MAG TPA: type II toxin-antitoxin system VapC family toxin [Arachnia sp.]|jgi:PIN domain nuclease of toxin-antitoxin system|nr:type II toxin-antitoxin system VapC family toxin [Propionibacteriaceae bacterium]HOA28372.1 type II toxin-antitoxin system VapC family toxin [Arachnia sp.]HQD23259.1 type II toxin-antitoxin system VapC family toxin [Arachnia sp.]